LSAGVAGAFCGRKAIAVLFAVSGVANGFVDMVAWPNSVDGAGGGYPSRHAMKTRASVRNFFMYPLNLFYSSVLAA